MTFDEIRGLDFNKKNYALDKAGNERLIIGFDSKGSLITDCEGDIIEWSEHEIKDWTFPKPETRKLYKWALFSKGGDIWCPEMLICDEGRWGNGVVCDDWDKFIKREKVSEKSYTSDSVVD